MLGELKRDGLTVLVVEQNAKAALPIADRGYRLDTRPRGRGGPRRGAPLVEAYLGGG